MNYIEQGTGKNTIIFLHGWGCTKEIFQSNIQFLSKKNKCVAIDFAIGQALDEPQIVYDIYRYAFEVFCFIKNKGYNNITLIGHSFGGRVAILLCSLFALDVNKLVLVDSAGLKPKLSIKTKLKIVTHKIKRRLNRCGFHFDLEKNGSADYVLLSDTMKKTFVNIVTEDLTKYLSKISIKTIVFWGRKDVDTPFTMAKKINSIIYNSDLVVVDAGHFSFIESRNTFNYVVDYFVGLE